MSEQNRVWFDSKEHKYYNALNKEYSGVTTLISKYKVKKDWNEIARKYAIKNGGNAEHWLRKWNKIKVKALDEGSKFHDFKEREVIESHKEVHFGKELLVDSGLIPYEIDNPAKLPNGVYTELMVWHHGFNVAGTADKIIKDGKLFDVDDYKTNKTIDTESFYHWKTGHEMMLKPLSHLMDCTLIHYELQLSTYAFILESYGLKCRSITFKHHAKIIDKETGKTYINPIPEIYYCKYRKDDVQLMLMDNLKKSK